MISPFPISQQENGRNAWDRELKLAIGLVFKLWIKMSKTHNVNSSKGKWVFQDQNGHVFSYVKKKKAGPKCGPVRPRQCF